MGGGWYISRLLPPRHPTRLQAAAQTSEPELPTRFIDLSSHFNDSLDDGWQHQLMAGNNLGTLPRGRQIFGGVEFDVRGIVQLTSPKLGQFDADGKFPERVRGIRVGRKCQELHFLHATGWDAAPGTWVGSYLVHYADDTTEAVRILYGQGTGNWWALAAEMKRPGDGVVWQGTNAANKPVQVFKQSWTNPHPDLEIKSLDFESRLTRVAPFLIAATAK
jgi:beta-galactosidase